MRKGRIKWVIGVGVVVLFIVAVLLLVQANFNADNAVAEPRQEPGQRETNPGGVITDQNLYSQKLAQWRESGIADAANAEIVIQAKSYAAASEGVEIPQTDLNGKSGAVVLTEAEQWAEYEFEVPIAGLYALNVQYLPLAGSFSPIRIAVEIDGQFPFAEAQNMNLERTWREASTALKQDERGNEIRPQQQEIVEWTDRVVTDALHTQAEPLRWHLSEGKHRLKIKSLFDAVAISRFSFVSPQTTPDYAEALANYPSTGTSGDTGWFIRLEAEQMTAKSDPALQMIATMDNLALPKSDGKVVYNAMGGERWKQGGQWAEWRFEVPEDGIYNIHLKYFQGFQTDLTVYRQIEVDGQVPFKELQAHPFPFRRSWQMAPLADAEGSPYAFYLTKGVHTLKMTATLAPLTPVIESMRALTKEIQNIQRAMRLVTGIRETGQDAGDANRDWDIEASIPDIRERFAALADGLQAQLDELERLYGSKISGEGGIRSAILDLRKLQANPNVLPKKPAMLSTVQETLGAYIDRLTKQSLTLDQIYIAKPQAELPDVLVGRWGRFANSVKNFFSTFSSDYYYYGRQDEDAITVWVNRGRDYVTLMQEMADELFTPATGIGVNVNLMPNPQLLILSNAAGREPDVALGLDAATPADFAMRNALVDMSQFPDYAQIADRFMPGSRLPFHYNGGDYALPETMSPNLLFVRTDILESLKIGIPQTWEDALDLLPTLQQKGYDFFVPAGNYLPFFYQNGARFYTPDGMKSGLDSPQAFAAFKQWTDLYTIYGFPREVPNFYMHFRNGDMPIGIADFNTYLQLLVAAPEIAGSWTIAPIPGIAHDGQVERWAGGPIQAGVIFKSSARTDDAWAFLKWWTSTDVQARFGTEMELQNGAEFRWNTANPEALKQLPWPSEHSDAVQSQLQWFKELPNVPGGYFTARELGFAWNRTVLEKMNFRESLELSLIEINREMLRKQQEFGFVDDGMNIVHRLDIPEVDNKREGAGQQ